MSRSISACFSMCRSPIRLCPVFLFPVAARLGRIGAPGVDSDEALPQVDHNDHHAGARRVTDQPVGLPGFGCRVGRIDQCAIVGEGLIGPRRVDVGIADMARRPGTDVLAPVLPVKPRGAFHDLSVLRLYDSIWRSGEDSLYIDIKGARSAPRAVRHVTPVRQRTLAGEVTAGTYGGGRDAPAGQSPQPGWQLRLCTL